MNDFELLLREDLDRSSAGIHIRPGLPERAYRHLSRRRTARAIAATAAAAAIAISATVAIGQPSGRPSAVTTAYVVRHSEAALGAVIAEDPVISVVSPDGSGGFGWGDIHSEISYAQTRSWYHGNDFRIQVLSAAGQPIDDDTTTATRETEILYTAHAWWQNPDPWFTRSAISPPPTCANDKYFGADGSPPQWAPDIKEALHCGLYRVAGTEQVSGSNAIKLVPVRPDHITAVLWLDPATYLPVKMATYTVGDAGRLVPQSTEYVSWLPPTSANLALLTPSAPAGFTRIPGRPALNCSDKACYDKWDKLTDAWYTKYLAPRLPSQPLPRGVSVQTGHW